MALAASSAKPLAAQAVEPIIDIHQHTGYHGRTDQQFIAHQRAMGITKTIILPAGTYVDLELKNLTRAPALRRDKDLDQV